MRCVGVVTSCCDVGVISVPSDSFSKNEASSSFFSEPRDLDHAAPCDWHILTE